MNKRLDEAINRLKALPDDRQGEAADLLFEFIEAEHADIRLTSEQIAEIERRAQDELAGAAEIHAPAHPEAEESDARAAVLAVLRRLELLRARVGHGEQAAQQGHHEDDSHSGSASVTLSVAQWSGPPAPNGAPPCARNPR